MSHASVAQWRSTSRECDGSLLGAWSSWPPRAPQPGGQDGHAPGRALLCQAVQHEVEQVAALGAGRVPSRVARTEAVADDDRDNLLVAATVRAQAGSYQ